MKHVFIVQSNITYLAALGVIAKRNLDPRDVIVLSEGYTKEAPVKVHVLALYQSFFKMIIAPKTYFNIASKADRLLGDFLADDTFELYTAVLTNLARLVLTNTKCSNLNFIEEGVSSYCRGFDLDTIVTYYRNNSNRPNFSSKYLRELKNGITMALRGFSPKMISYPIFYQAYADSPGVKFWGFHEDCFPLCSTVELLSLERLSETFHFANQYDLNNCAIWLGDDCVSCYNYPLEQYLSGIENGFANKINKTKAVYVKFHPSESNTSRKATLDILKKNGITPIIIPKEVILETELVGKINVSLYGTYSSLLIYGAMMGCNAYTVHNYLHDPFSVNVPLFKNMVKCI